MAEHNPSRRALLGAAVALPFAGAVPRTQEPKTAAGRSGSASGTSSEDWILDQVRDDGEWERALAAFRAAEAELRAFERRTAGAPWEAQEGVERGMDERLDALCPALLGLVGAPAPDLEAVLVKIGLIEAHDVASLDGGGECLAALGRDVRRLISK